MDPISIHNPQKEINQLRNEAIPELAKTIGESHPEMKQRLEKYLERAEGLDSGIIANISSRGTVALYMADTLRSGTENILTTVRVFGDKESSPHEQTAAVLKCISSFTMLVGLTGPIGLTVGTTISTLLGIITLILEGTSPERETEMHKLEGLLRGLKAEDAEMEVRAAQGRITAQLKTIQSFKDGSKTWDGKNSILMTAPITSDISQFMLAKTGEWLRNPKNVEVEQWEQVFMAYSSTLIHVINLQFTMLLKLREQDRGTMMAYIQEYGSQIETWFDDLMNIVNGCGKYWHTARRFLTGCYVKNPWQPPRSYGGWEDMNIGRIGALAISPQTGRIWATSPDDQRHLLTGKMGEMFAVSENELIGCTDVYLIPWAAEGTDMVIVTATGDQSNGIGHLMVNFWKEKRSRFFTLDELKSGAEKGVVGKWIKPNISGGIVMARPFRFSSMLTPVIQERVYLVSVKDEKSNSPKYTLSFIRLDDLQQTKFPVQPAVIDIPQTEGLPFRISVSKSYLYLFTRRKAWRVKHEFAVVSAVDQWQEVDMPSGLTDFDGGLWQENQPDWWSNGINDLHVWSDHHVVCALHGLGEIWCGDYDGPDRRKWGSYDFEFFRNKTSVDQLPQKGYGLMIVAEIQNLLYFRVFDEQGNIVIQTEERKLHDSANLFSLRSRLKSKDSFSAAETSLIISDVTKLIGSTWRWRQISGGARRVMKEKSDSYDYCRLLHQAGSNLKAGKPEFIRSPQ